MHEKVGGQTTLIDPALEKVGGSIDPPDPVLPWSMPYRAMYGRHTVCFCFVCLKAEDGEHQLGEWSTFDKIRVCVRKRPRTTREVKRSETDVVKIRGRQTVIVEELKVAVDLTKFIQQVCAQFGLRVY